MTSFLPARTFLARGFAMTSSAGALAARVLARPEVLPELLPMMNRPSPGAAVRIKHRPARRTEAKHDSTTPGWLSSPRRYFRPVRPGSLGINAAGQAGDKCRSAPGCISVLVGRRKSVVASPPARVGNLAQGCTDRQMPNTLGRRRVDGNTPGRCRVDGNTPGRCRVDGNTPGRCCVAGHGFSRGTVSPPPPSPPPAGKVQVWPKASIPRGEGPGRGGPENHR